MATYSRQLLSGSVNGRVIPVGATATPGTLLHTALAGVAGFDEIYLWGSNVTGSAVTLNLEWGGVTDPGDLGFKALSIPANSGLVVLVNGLVLQNALNVRAFASSANAINIAGFVNRIQ